jgi:hypothetical protein
MGLKFRRGTTAQKSGSLAFGEPYINTDLGTLQVGGATGDITLGASGTGSQGSFAGISGSSLNITGNGKIDGNLTLGGNITIGDNTADNVTVVASLSSSIIPSLDSIFDLGSPTKQWRDLYLSSASLYIDGTQVISSNATELIFTTDTGQSIKFNELGTDNITLQTADGDIELKSSGGGDVLLDPTAGLISVKGNVSMQDGTAKFLSSGGTDIVFGNNLVVTGSITTTGNANIAGNLTLGGNITIGDNTSDTVNMTAALSSSLIPSVTNAFDLGSASKIWRDLYISTGSIKFVGAGGTVVGTLTNTGNGLNLDGGVIANGDSSFGTASVSVTSVTGSLRVSGSLTTIGTSTATSFNGAINATNGVVSGSSQITYASISSIPAGIVSGSSQVTGIGNAQLTNSSTTIGTTAIALGASATTIAGLTSVTSTGFTGALTGNASTATTAAALTTARTINGTSFDGSANITIPNLVSGSAQVTLSSTTGGTTSSNVQFNSLGIGMAASATAGRIDATNDVGAFSSSDIRFKENIVPIENALDKISKISGNTYDWKAENKIEHGYEGNDVGVIAQEIEAVLPQLVQTRENGFKAVKYDKLVALLIEGIKEQQTQIEKLRIDLDNYECKCDNCKSK